jgi:predicted DNA-binding transcriptional regulator YafY
MPVNKSALIRYKTIDNCLQNRLRKWTLDDLITACSEALYEYEGISKGVSRRSVQQDLQTMRSEKLGYNAPIIVTDKKYYSYEDKEYSINQVPLSGQDINTLNEVLGILRQFNTFGYFQELQGIVARLEDKIYKQQHDGVSYIDFEKNELLRGLQHIDGLHKTIINTQTLNIVYKSFKASTEQTIVFYPYLLKEYRNRWFLLGKRVNGNDVMTLALDRIESFTEAVREKYVAAPFDVHSYFGNLIGVTKTNNQRSQNIVLHICKEHAPYIKTKPMHSSQRILNDNESGMTFAIQVIWNFELEREILGFGEFIKVVSPLRLARKINGRHINSSKNYHFKESDL